MDGKNVSAISTYAAIFFFIVTISGFAATSSVERDTTKYIVLRVLPSDPALATSLLTALLRSSPSSLRVIRRLLERQNAVLEREQDTMDDIRLKRREMSSFLHHIHNSNNLNNNNNNNINDINKHETDNVDFATKNNQAFNHNNNNNDENGGATRDNSAASADTDTTSAGTQGFLGTELPGARRMSYTSLWKPKRAMIPNKRSLGRCIHDCINGKGNMNFIQCKSMCH